MIDNLAPSLDMIVQRQNKDSVLSIPMRRCLRLYHRYEDDCPVVVPKPSFLLLEPLISDYPLAVPFTDRVCQSSNIVGGKGSSLALLSTLQHQLSVPSIRSFLPIMQWYLGGRTDSSGPRKQGPSVKRWMPAETCLKPHKWNSKDWISACTYGKG
uniref:Uncharacterized protein n=1 Tax=Timema tahoe TaxID=61484 RepID=A0A7R9IMY1_9NEOP|nr:unnamed protein product [Timema tahoe]